MAVLGVLACVGWGCGSASDRSLAEGGPGDRVRAVAASARGETPEDLDALIDALDSDDPAERMLAISALKRLTGLTLGYDFSASRAERTASIGRWVEWRRAERPDGTHQQTGRDGANAAPVASGEGL